MTDNKNLEEVASSIGKRKEAVAFVKVYNKDQTDNSITFINGIPAELYLQFNSKLLNTISLPLEILNSKNKFTLEIDVKGGGLSGQTDAIQLAISRSLCQLDENNRTVLKKYGFLTRDSRIKESKKYGLKKARKASQYSKR